MGQATRKICFGMAGLLPAYAFENQFEFGSPTRSLVFQNTGWTLFNRLRLQSRAHLLRLVINSWAIWGLSFSQRLNEVYMLFQRVNSNTSYFEIFNYVCYSCMELCL